MKKFAYLVVHNAKTVLLVTLASTILISIGITKLRVVNNQDSELPKDDAIVQTDNRLKSIFGEKDIVIIGIESNDIFSTGTLNKVSLISEELKSVDGVVEDEITSISTINNINGKEWGLEVGPLMKEVPQTREEIDQLKKDIKKNKLILGRLVSSDGKFTAVIANISRHSDQAVVFNKVDAIARKYSVPEKIYLAGAPVQIQEVDQGIQKDVALLLPISLLLVLISFFISFRTWQGVLLPFLVVVLSIIWTMGLMGFLGFHINVVSSAIPLLMIAASSSYGIHMMQRYYEESIFKDHKESIVKATAHIMPAILITGLTSVIGLATLVVFKVASIREFGIITAAGTLATMILPITVIPACLSLLKRSMQKATQINTSYFDKTLIYLAKFSIRYSKPILISTFIVFIIAAAGVYNLKVGADFVKYFPEGHRLRNTFEKFNEKLGGARTLNVMIEGESTDAIKDPVLLGKIAAFQQYANSLKGVGNTNSFADVVSRINLEMHDGNPAFDNIPDSRNIIAQYLLLYSMSGDPGDFNDLVDYDYRRAKIQIMLNTSEQEEHQHIYSSLKKYAASNFGSGVKTEFGGEVMFWLAQVRYVVIGKIQNIISGILFVALFCIIIFRSFMGGLLSIVPLSISTLITFGLMGFLGLRLETGSAIITAIVIGIGVDFAIHYLMRFKELMKETGNFESTTIETMLTSGKSIIFNVLSNVLGFSVFVFSGFLPIQYFGWLICITMLTVAFGSLIIFPPLFMLLKPGFIFGNKNKASNKYELQNNDAMPVELSNI